MHFWCLGGSRLGVKVLEYPLIHSVNETIVHTINLSSIYSSTLLQQTLGEILQHIYSKGADKPINTRRLVKIHLY